MWWFQPHNVPLVSPVLSIINDTLLCYGNPIELEYVRGEPKVRI